MPDELSSLPAPGRTPLSPDERERAARLLAIHYRRGRSIRGLASQSGYSYGRVRTLLLAAGVTLAARGGRRSTPRNDSEGDGDQP